jgi:DNA-binding transcriptional ArsR family regulator
VKALAHPLRVRILGLLDDRVASPSELAQRLEAPLGNVSYHVRILASLGLIRLVSETPRRGSVEHHYTTVAHPTISNEAWAGVPEIVKNAMIGAALEQAGATIGAGAASGGFNRLGAHLTRTPLELDQQGWDAVVEVLLQTMAQIDDIGEEAAKRLARGDEAGTDAAMIMMFFETPAEESEEPQAAPAEHELADASSTAA